MEEVKDESLEVKSNEEVKDETLEVKSNEEVKEVKKNKKGNKEVETLKELLKASEEKAMRIQAEMQNFKRRKEEEVINIKKYANEDILKELILVVDNFERALKMETEENKDFLKGFFMIYTNILKILNDNNVTEIVADNVAFDPAIHQAVLTEKREGVEAGIVVEVLQKGYMYKDRVLRAAMVKVSE